MYDSLKLLTNEAVQDIVRSKTKSISKALRVVVVLQSLQNKIRAFGKSVTGKKFDFPLMFGSNKCFYLIVFGLAPYFSNQIIKAIGEVPCFLVSFDESMNGVTENE